MSTIGGRIGAIPGRPDAASARIEAPRRRLRVLRAGVAWRGLAWRGPAAMTVMVLGMLDTMLPGLRLVPAVLWVAIELGLAIAVALPERGSRRRTPQAAHRALGLVLMAALTVTMAGMGAASGAAATATTAAGGTGTGADPGTGAAPGAMPGMGHGLVLLPLALAAAAVYCGWSLWRARRHGARGELLLSAASVALMAVFAAL